MNYLAQKAKESIPEVKEKLIRTRDRLKYGCESIEDLLNTNKCPKSKKNCFSIEKCLCPGGIPSAAHDVLQSQIGLALQDFLVKKSTQKVRNFDSIRKEKGVDLLVVNKLSYSPLKEHIDCKKNVIVSLKSKNTTQTGSHTNDAIMHLINKADEFNAVPCIAYAIGKPNIIVKDKILYISGKKFWEWHGITNFEREYLNVIKEFSNFLNCTEFKCLFSEIHLLANNLLNRNKKQKIKKKSKIDLIQLLSH